MDKLTEKQKRFACEYLIDQNATQSAIRAGYSQKTATEQGARLLTNVKVKAYIDEQLKKIESEKIAKAEEVIQYLTKVLRGEEVDEVVVVEGQGDGVSVAKRIKKEVSIKDKLKSAELLGKYYALYTDKTDTTVTVTPTIIEGGGELED